MTGKANCVFCNRDWQKSGKNQFANLIEIAVTEAGGNSKDKLSPCALASRGCGFNVSGSSKVLHSLSAGALIWRAVTLSIVRDGKAIVASTGLRAPVFTTVSVTTPL